MFIITNGCNEIVIDGTTVELAITLHFPSSVVDLIAFAELDNTDTTIPFALLVDASPALVSLSISILSFVVVAGILLQNRPALARDAKYSSFDYHEK